MYKLEIIAHHTEAENSPCVVEILLCNGMGTDIGFRYGCGVDEDSLAQCKSLGMMGTLNT